MGRVKWSKVIESIKNDVLPTFYRQGVKPTLRTIFYALVSRNIIPNTKSSYKRLSEVLVEARKKGVFPWDFIEDRVRYTMGKFDDYKPSEDVLGYVERECRDILEVLDINHLLDTQFNYLKVPLYVGYWADQPVVPEIWIEKDALATTIDNWTRDLYVTIRVNRGYSSWTFIYNNVQDLRRILENHNGVVVLYLGDLDPSGVDIQRFLDEALSYFGHKDDVVIKRLAVTPEQVERYNLPPRPEDAETLAKIERDPRSRKYRYRYIVELDALVAYVPSEFRRLVREEIQRYHDTDIYLKARRDAEDLNRRSMKIIERYKEKAKKKILKQLGVE